MSLLLFLCGQCLGACAISITSSGVTCGTDCQAAEGTYTFENAVTCDLTITGTSTSKLIFKQENTLNVQSVTNVENLRDITIQADALLTLTFTNPTFVMPSGLVRTGTGPFKFDFTLNALSRVSFLNQALHFFAGDASSSTPELQNEDQVAVTIPDSTNVELNFLGLEWNLTPTVTFTFQTTSNVQLSCVNYGMLTVDTPFLKFVGNSQSSITVLRSEDIEISLMDVMTFETFKSSTFEPVYTEDYCLCPNDRLIQCKTDKYCSAYGVPEANYYASKSSEFADTLSNAGVITNINVYVTSFVGTEEDQYHRLTLEKVTGDTRTFNFIAADGNDDTKMKIYLPADMGKYALSFSGISSVQIKPFGVAQATPLDIPSLSLTGSYLLVEDSDEMKVAILNSDMSSLSRIEGRLVVGEAWTIAASTPASIKGLYLKNEQSQNVIMTVSRISLTPIINLRENGFVLTDGNEEITVGCESSVALMIHDTNPNAIQNVTLNTGTTTTDNLVSLTFNMSSSFSLQINNEDGGIGSDKTISVITNEGDAVQMLNVSLLKTPTGNLTLEVANKPSILALGTLAAVKYFKTGYSGLKGFYGNCEKETFKLALGNGNLCSLTIGSESITYATGVVTDSFAIQTVAPTVTLSGAGQAKPAMSIVVESDGTNIEFANDFTSTEGMSIQHQNYTVTLKSQGATVPNVGIVNPITGVLFSATTKEFSINSATFDKEFNGRSGPDLSVTVEGELVRFPQSAFLAESVTFSPKSGAAASLLFQYTAKSSVNYHFKLPVSFENAANSRASCLFMEFTALTLSNSPLMAKSADQKIGFTVDKLQTDVASLQSEYVCENGISTGSISIVDPDITNATIGMDYVTMANTKSVTPVIKVSPSDNSESVVCTVSAGKQVKFSAAAKTVLRTRINAEAGSTIRFDSSWYNLTNPTDVIIDASAGDVKIDTDLLIMPRFTIQGDKYLITVGSPKFTADLSFYLFVGILGAVAIASIILCIIGCTCLKPEEEIDFSTSEEEEKGEEKKKEGVSPPPKKE